MSRYYAEITARLNALPAGPSLEVPCGNVPFLAYAEAYRNNGPWLFVDLSWTLLRQVARKCAAHGLTRHLAVRADARSLPVADSQMQNIVSMFGLHCFHDKSAVFAELHRCLSAQGAMVGSTLTNDGHTLSRFYHRLNQTDGTFAPDNSVPSIRCSAQAQGFLIRDELQLGSAYLFGAAPCRLPGE